VPITELSRDNFPVSQIARDNEVGIVIGVIAAVIVSVLTVFTVGPIRLEGVLVFGLCLAVCGLVLSVLGTARQRAGRITGSPRWQSEP
jgi:putative exporter of polyketide antibiotics